MKNIHLIKEEYIKCGDCNKHYLCTTCGAQCGSEGHFIESTKQKQCDCTDKCLGYLTKTCTRKQEQKQHLINIMRCDEEIKEGDWFYSAFQNEERILKYNKFVIPFPKDKKIILTTDQDLIKDGVQAIDDEFLEWFVNNPSCEEVEVDRIELNTDYRSDWKQKFRYKVIIQKEEQKQHLIDMMKGDEELGLYDNNTAIGMHTLTDTTTGCNSSRFGKQETIEEAAEKESEVQGWGKYESNSEQYAIKQSFIRGAEWQAKRRYSDEEVCEFIEWINLHYRTLEHTLSFKDAKNTKDLLKQFKKK